MKMNSAPLFLGIPAIPIILGISGIIGMVCWPYTINHWLVFFDKQPSCMWWHGFLLGCMPWIGQASIPAAIITWFLFALVLIKV